MADRKYWIKIENHDWEMTPHNVDRMGSIGNAPMMFPNEPDPVFSVRHPWVSECPTLSGAKRVVMKRVLFGEPFVARKTW